MFRNAVNSASRDEFLASVIFRFFFKEELCNKVILALEIRRNIVFAIKIIS